MSDAFLYDWCLVSGRSVPKPVYHDDDTNQDAYGSWCDEAGRAVIVACDGAGSLAKSREGARLVADTIVSEGRIVLERFESSGDADVDAEALREKILAVLVMAMNTVWGAQDSDEMGCTVAAAIFCEGAFAYVTLGDAFVLVGDYAGSTPKYQSHVEMWDAPNITTFTTSDNPHILVSCGTGATWCMVASDGMKNPLVRAATAESDEAVEESLFREGDDGEPPLYLVLFSSKHTDDFLAHLEREKYLDDDTTFVMAGCLNKPAEGSLRMITESAKAKLVPGDYGFVERLQLSLDS